MSVHLSPIGNAFQFFNTNGRPLSLGSLYTYAAGTSTPQTTYSDSAGSVPNANPIVLDASGRVVNEVWLTDAAAYKFVLKDAGGSTIGTYDNIAGINDFTSLIAEFASSTPPTGASLVGWKSTAGGAVGTTVQVKLQEIVNVKDFGAVGDGITDDTGAFQAAITAYQSTGARIYCPGTFKIGNLTFPAGKAYRLEVNGGLVLTATLVLPSDVDLIGVGGDVGSQFGLGTAALITPPPGTLSTLKITGQASHYLENLHISHPGGIGIEFDGTTVLGALCRMQNVTVDCAGGVATAIPLRCKTFFWIYMENCVFITAAGNLGYSLIFETLVNTSGGYTGLVFMKDCTISGFGMQINANFISPNFKFENLVFENCLSNLLTVDSTNTTSVQDVEFIRPQISDPVIGTVYLVKVNTGVANKIRLKELDWTFNIVDPTSKQINGLYVEGMRNFEYTAPVKWVPNTILRFNAQFEDGLDSEWIGSAWVGGPRTIGYDTLAVEQNVANWTGLASGGATVTTGKIAPDGTLTAALVAGTPGGVVQVLNQAYTPAVGDWLIYGVWLQATDATKLPARALLTLPLQQATFNTTLTYFDFLQGIESARGDGNWHCIVSAAKIATAVGGADFLRFDLQVETATATYSTTNFWMPFVIKIPSGTMTDAQAIQLKRTLRNAVSNTVAGDVAVLPHQKLALGGGARLFSASAVPSTGAWRVGDRVTNSAPAVGQPKGWLCTVAGTPGTWVSEGNL